MENNYNDYYKNKLEEAKEYQDIVTEELYKHGIVLIGYSSKKYQYKRGENILGAEIKYQAQYKDYKTLAIETEEKSHPNNPNYVSSGIYRNDNSWLFVTGDRKTLYIFSTKFLRMLDSSGKYKRYENKTKTSKGFILPVEDAEKYCIRKVDLGVSNG